MTATSPDAVRTRIRAGVRTASGIRCARPCTRPQTCPDTRPDTSADDRPERSGHHPEGGSRMRLRNRDQTPETPRAPHWDENAACKQSATPDYWFAEGADVIATADREVAKKVCHRCPVRVPCLRAALDRGETTGVWGGMDAGERQALTLDPPPLAEEHADAPARQAQTA